MESEIADQLRRRIEAEFRRSEAGTPSTEFPGLPDIPAARYTDAAFEQLEAQFLWPRTWLIAGHVDEIPERGSYKLWDDSGVPILIVRDKEGTIRAFYNSCRHRGGPLAIERTGKVSVLSCKIHGWTFDLTGELKFVPDENEFPGLKKEERHLRELRCELWGNFIFVNRDSAAPPLLEWLGPLVDEFEDYDFSKRRVFAKSEYDIDSNWKIGIESNAEVYHFPITHKNTVNLVFAYQGTVFDLYRNGHSRMVVPYSKEYGEEASKLLDLRVRAPKQMLTREAIGNYLIFPNLLCSANEFQFPLITYWPRGSGKSKIILYHTTPFENEDPDSAQCREVIRAFEIALEEDRIPLGYMQKSFEQRLLDKVRFSCAERRLYYMNEEVDRVIGTKNIPAAYRVEPVAWRYINEPGKSTQHREQPYAA